MVMASRGFASRRAPCPVRSTATTASTRRSERRNGTRRSQHQAPCAPPWTSTKLVNQTSRRDRPCSRVRARGRVGSHAEGPLFATIGPPHTHLVFYERAL